MEIYLTKKYLLHPLCKFEGEVSLLVAQLTAVTGVSKLRWRELRKIKISVVKVRAERCVARSFSTGTSDSKQQYRLPFNLVLAVATELKRGVLAFPFPVVYFRYKFVFCNGTHFNFLSLFLSSRCRFFVWLDSRLECYNVAVFSLSSSA